MIPICKDCIDVVSELSKKKKAERVERETKNECSHSPVPSHIWTGTCTSGEYGGYTCTFCGKWIRVKFND